MLPRFVRDGRGRANDRPAGTGRGVFVQPFTAPSGKRLRCCWPVALRLVGWRWCGGGLEAGAVAAECYVEAGGGLTGAGDGLPGRSLVGAGFGLRLSSGGDGVVAGLAVVEVSGGIGERGARMVFTNNGGTVS